MKVLVTGANGHIGANLVRLLLERGHDVRALVRPASDLRGLTGVAVELVRGDARDADAVRSAVRDRETVFHLAAPTRTEPGLEQSIVEGSRILLDACLKGGVGRVVYTSSVVTVGYADSPANVLTEESRTETNASAYHTGKWRAEQDTLAFGAATGLPVVVVNPSTVVGRLDYRITPSTAPLFRCLRKGLPVTFDSGLTIAPVRDVALGHLLAAERGAPGERYILGGERLMIRDYFALLCRLCNRPAPRLHLPRALMLALGLAGSAAEAAGFRNVPFTFRQASKLAGKYAWYSSEKARQKLGYSWHSAEEAALDYITWRRETGDAHE
jgi:dihydroflavonol-4-reductase